MNETLNKNITAFVFVFIQRTVNRNIFNANSNTAIKNNFYYFTNTARMSRCQCFINSYFP